MGTSHRGFLLCESHTRTRLPLPPFPAKGIGRSPKRATWRILPGVCTDSLALEVALACRVPSQVVQRAATLYSRIRPYTQLRGSRPQMPPAPELGSTDAQREAELEAALRELRSVAAASAPPNSRAQGPVSARAADAIVGPRERLPHGADGGVWWLYAMRWRADGAWAVGATSNLRLCREQARRRRGLLDLVCIRVSEGIHDPGGSSAAGSDRGAACIDWGAAVGGAAVHRMAVAGFKLVVPPAF